MQIFIWGLVQVRKAKIDDLEIICAFFQKYIFRLQIPVANTILVQMLNTTEELLEKVSAINIGDPFMLHDIVKELSSVGMLHD